MEIRRADANTIELSDLDLFICELLLQITVSADPDGSDAAEQRLYSSPTAGQEPEFDNEWKEYVEPDLRELFQSTLDTVRDDLKGFPSPEIDEGFSLSIPVNHLENWIHALNQARLALAAWYDVSEKDMDSMPTGGDARALAVFQIHFYGYLQERFLRELTR